MLFICYPRCTTCQKAQKWLDVRGFVYDYRSIKNDKPSNKELKSWYLQSGLPLKNFWNTRGLLYKKLGLKDKIPKMSDEEQLQMLATDGMLVKRPILIDDNLVLAGFNNREWENKLKTSD